MAGIYIHIPFCKKKCYYCDFYSTTNSELKENFVLAIKKEIEIKSHYLNGESISSIYIGGGSPSMLTIFEIEQILEKIKNYFEILPAAEITFECNPDDVSLNYFVNLKKLGINRLSIGIQSFDDNILKFLNRRHDAKRGEKAIESAKESGLKNISVDLMFGIPGMSNEIYERSLDKAIGFNIKHVSAYHLSIETNTLLYKKLNKGEFTITDEEVSLYQFNLTIEKLKDNGYIHYEVSNYALEGYESKHNLLYWNNEKYLGLGPSAHSYDGISRQWNISNTGKYVDLLSKGSVFFTKEELKTEDKFNEYILTKLRTNIGVSLSFVKKEFDSKIYKHFVGVLQKVAEDGYLYKISDDRWTVNKDGLFILDLLIEKFYYI